MRRHVIADLTVPLAPRRRGRHGGRLQQRILIPHEYALQEPQSRGQPGRLCQMPPNVRAAAFPAGSQVPAPTPRRDCTCPAAPAALPTPAGPSLSSAALPASTTTKLHHHCAHAHTRVRSGGARVGRIGQHVSGTAWASLAALPGVGCSVPDGWQRLGKLFCATVCVLHAMYGRRAIV